MDAPDPESLPAADAQAPITRGTITDTLKTVGYILGLAVCFFSLGGGAYKWVSESGAAQANLQASQGKLVEQGAQLVTLRAELTTLAASLAKLIEQSAQIGTLRSEMDNVKIQNQRSIDDRAQLHADQERARADQQKDTDLVNRALDKLSEKLDRLLEGQQQHQPARVTH